MIKKAWLWFKVGILARYFGLKVPISQQLNHYLPNDLIKKELESRDWDKEKAFWRALGNHSPSRIPMPNAYEKSIKTDALKEEEK